MIKSSELLKQKGKRIKLLLTNGSPMVISGVVDNIISREELMLTDAECESGPVTYLTGYTAHIQLGNIATWFIKEL